MVASAASRVGFTLPFVHSVIVAERRALHCHTLALCRRLIRVILGSAPWAELRQDDHGPLTALLLDGFALDGWVGMPHRPLRFGPELQRDREAVVVLSQSRVHVGYAFARHVIHSLFRHRVDGNQDRFSDLEHVEPAINDDLC